MYNGIGLRTVRGSGTNGYVQRNLSYVNISHARQKLARNQRGIQSGLLDTRGGGRNHPPPNPDILLHEQKRKVELQLLEMSLEMEGRGCEPDDIHATVKRERERLLARLNDKRGDKANNVENSRSQQKYREDNIERIKNAFGIDNDYVAGESFDPEMQERRRQERKERREQDWKESEEARRRNVKDKKEEAMTLPKNHDLPSRSYLSRSRTHSQSKISTDRRSIDRSGSSRSDTKTGHGSTCNVRSLEKKHYRRLPSNANRRRRSTSSSSSGYIRSKGLSALNSSQSRSRALKAWKNRQIETENAACSDRSKRLQSLQSLGLNTRSRSSSSTELNHNRNVAAGVDRGKKVEMTEGQMESKILSERKSVSRPAPSDGEYKILNLSAPAVADGVLLSEERGKSSLSLAKITTDEQKNLTSKKQEANRKNEPKIYAQNKKNDQLTKHEKEKNIKAPDSSIADLRTRSSKRNLHSKSPDDRRRRGKRMRSLSSSPRHPGERSRRNNSRSSGRSNSRSDSTASSRFYSRSRSPSRSKSYSRSYRRRGYSYRRNSPRRSRSRGRTRR
ncbi:putative mRNA splicing factor Cwf21 domain-containing protein [Plasmopara halstedii]